MRFVGFKKSFLAAMMLVDTDLMWSIVCIISGIGFGC